MRLSKKIALITGAAGPMGEAIALRFAQEGANLILTDISQRRLSAICTRLPPRCDVLAIKADALDNEQLAGVVARAIDHFGAVDLLVNIVGGIVSSRITTPLLEMSDEQFEATLRLNLRSIVLTARHVVPQMQQRNYGRIVNISSVAMCGEAGQADYSAAKAGVAGLTRTMAIEFSPHITVNCIAPALVGTRVLDRLDPMLVDAWRDRTLLKRLGQPIDIAHAALFLASDEASFITGVQLPVSGGICPAL